MRYIAVQPIKHEGKRAEPGEAVEMTAAQAAPLLASGALQADRKAAVDKAAAEKAAADKAAADKAAADKDSKI